MGLAEGMERQWRRIALSASSVQRNRRGRTGFREGEIRSLLFLGELGLGWVNRKEGFLAAEALREKADHYQAAYLPDLARLLLARYANELGRRSEAITALQEADAILSIQRSRPESGDVRGGLPPSAPDGL